MISPNQLTVLRMAFVPLLVILIVYRHLGWAVVVFLTAGITDMLDGLIARKWGRKTDLGTFLDPIADKVLLVSSFIILSFGASDLVVEIPAWLTITVVSRDLLLVLSVLIFNLTIGRRAFPPSILGKWTTVFQLFLIMLVLLANHFHVSLPGLGWLFYLVMTLTVASGLHYMVQGMSLIGTESASSGSLGDGTGVDDHGGE